MPAVMLEPLTEALFREETRSTFREGYIFRSTGDMQRTQRDQSEWGYWTCDLENQDTLIWSDKVYDLFGLPFGTPIRRDWAVSRYSEHSRSTLQRVRDFALRHACSFILDAEIEPQAGVLRWIRILAIPISENGHVSQLYGLKRAL